MPATLHVGDTSYTDVDTHRGTARRLVETDILRESSNVGTIEIAQQPRRRTSSPTALRASGSAQKTAVDFPGQAPGCCSIPTSTTPPGSRRRAIGYGVAVTAHADARRVRDDRQRRRDRSAAPLDATIDAHGERHDAAGRAGEARRLGADRGRDDDDAHARSCATAPARARRSPATRSRARPARRARRCVTAATRTRRWRRSSASRRRRTRGSRRSWCSTSPRTSTAVAAAPVFAEIMQFALNAVPRRSPTDVGATRQYDARTRRHADDQGSNCTVLARRGPRKSTSPSRPPPRPRPPGPQPTAPGRGRRAERRRRRPVRLPGDTSQSG